MLSESGLKAVASIAKVRLEQATPFYLFFSVDGTDVTYDMRKGLWICGCIHETYKGIKPELCWHVKSCKMWLRERRYTFKPLEILTEGMEL